MAKHRIQVTVNGAAHEAEVESRLLLVHLIREVFRLTGTHIGCDTSHCGACTVLLDGEPVKSCTVLAVQADGSPDQDRRGARAGRQAAPDPRGLHREARPAMRLLHAGHADDELRAAGAQQEPQRAGNPRGNLGKPVPVHGLRQHRPRRAVRGRAYGVELSACSETMRRACEAFRSSPFKGEARRGMGHSSLKPIPTPALPLKGREPYASPGRG